MQTMKTKGFFREQTQCKCQNTCTKHTLDYGQMPGLETKELEMH